MRDSGGTERLAFLKMHGLGNDFVIIDSRGGPAVTTPALARALGDRHRGVGFDQLAEIRDGSQGRDVLLEFWNPDGGRAGACGNATRCVGQLLLDASGEAEVHMRTSRGLLTATRCADGRISANMGPPSFDWRSIPLSREVCDTAHLPLAGDPAAVGMGNPHCVFFVAELARTDVAATGPRIETDPLFPERTNVEFAQVLSPDRLRLRVWERGTGITLACGSGACAAAVAAHRRGLTGPTVAVELDGGRLDIHWREDGVWMTGPVSRVFEGRLDPDLLATAR